MPQPQIRTTRSLLAIWLPLLAVVLIFVTLPDASQTSTAGPSREGTSTVGSANMRASIDPETGALSVNPTPLPAYKALAAALDRSSEGLVLESLPNGTRRVNLQGRFQSASVARLDAQGHLHTLCTEDLTAAEKLLQGKTPTQPRKLEVK